MRGIILKFDELTSEGLILGNDGKRYTFNYNKHWLNRNKELTLDSDVDFIPKEKMATEIFSLNSPSAKNDTVVTEDKDTLKSSFKKIDFELLSKNVKNPEKISKVKKETRFEFFVLLVFLGTLCLLMYLSLLNDWSFALLFLLLLFVIFTIETIKSFFKMFISRAIAKAEIISDEYKKELTIINFAPDNLSYEIIDMIQASAKSYNEAEKDLITSAYNLKADAIISLENDTVTASEVKSNLGNINTKVHVVHTLRGVAIKIK